LAALLLAPEKGLSPPARELGIIAPALRPGRWILGQNEAIDWEEWPMVVIRDTPSLAAAITKVLRSETKTGPEKWLQQLDPGHVADAYFDLMFRQG